MIGLTKTKRTCWFQRRI